MHQEIPLRSVLSHGGAFTPSEAIAVALELIGPVGEESDLFPPFGPPTLDNLSVQPDGGLVCRTFAATPAVSEIGILLDSMLPYDGATRVPGALRYTIARALLEVDAPPFDSIHDLAAALLRHVQDDRRAVLRALHLRAVQLIEQSSRQAADASRTVAPSTPERRRQPAAVAELRRHLRAADEDRYRLMLRTKQAAAPEAPLERNALITVAFDPLILRTEPIEPSDEVRRFRPLRWLAGGAAAAVLAFGAGYALVAELRPRTLPSTIASIVSAAPGLESTSSSPAISDAAAQPSEPLRRRREHGPDVVRAVSQSAGSSFSPAFASNGTALFFHTGQSSDGRSALEAADLGASDLHVMTIVDDGAKNFHVQPSPDGSQVAFDSDRDGERGVYIANRDGTSVRRVSGSGYAAVPSWAPDGTRLAFVRAEPDRPRVWNLWLLGLATGDMQRLTSYRFGQTWTASWFSDGRRLAYTHEDRLIVRDLATGATREYASPIRDRLVRTAAVSPDGRHVIFQVARSGAWLLDLGDGSMRCVLTDPTAEEFAWSPDGRRVAFHSRRDGQWGIWLLAPQG
jgi:hypothetical protein